jgi:hypothetical protein
MLVNRCAGARLVGAAREAHLAGLAGQPEDHSRQIGI